MRDQGLSIKDEKIQDVNCDRNPAISVIVEHAIPAENPTLGWLHQPQIDSSPARASSAVGLQLSRTPHSSGICLNG